MIMINEKYYFLEKSVTGIDINITYPTLWHGYLTYVKNDITDKSPINLLDIDNILIDICDNNFYLNNDSENIYISLDRDSKYYVEQFEKQIKKVIKQIEEMLYVTVTYGEFNATEIKHNGSQYKYTLTRNKTDNKIILKKIILNWDVLDGSKKLKRHDSPTKNNNSCDDIVNKMSNVKI